jgi:hypothetical protein
MSWSIKEYLNHLSPNRNSFNSSVEDTLESMKKMGMMANPPNDLQLWYSLFNRVQIISNGETPGG